MSTRSSTKVRSSSTSSTRPISRARGVRSLSKTNLVERQEFGFGREDTRTEFEQKNGGVPFTTFGACTAFWAFETAVDPYTSQRRLHITLLPWELDLWPASVRVWFAALQLSTPEGCDGGYAFLAARWASDVGLVPKNCSVEDPQAVPAAAAL